MNKKLFAVPMIASFIFALATPVLAENSSVNAQMLAIVGTCMQSAVDKRDTALIGVMNTYNTAITTALATRRDSLKVAWVLSDKDARLNGLKTAWNAFRNSHRQALMTKRVSRQSTWKQFRNDGRGCNPRGIAGNNNEEGAGIDSQL